MITLLFYPNFRKLRSTDEEKRSDVEEESSAWVDCWLGECTVCLNTAVEFLISLGTGIRYILKITIFPGM